MTFQRQHQIVRGHTISIICDDDGGLAATINAIMNLAGGSVESIFHQFLAHGSWPLEHLTGGNLAIEMFR